MVCVTSGKSFGELGDHLSSFPSLFPNGQTVDLIPGAAILDKKGRKMRRKETVSVTVDLPEDSGLPLSAWGKNKILS